MAGWGTLFRFVKFEHTLFSLPIIFAGSVLAARDGIPFSTILFILLAGTGARTVAMVLNRIIDRRIDEQNPRTKTRELPAGKLSHRQAWFILASGLILYLLSAALISVKCLLLSPIPLAIFLVYPYLKRFTSLAHFGVGAGLAMAPLGGWYAVRLSFDGWYEAALLALFTFFWVAGFDIIYSTLDEEFDRKHGFYSLPSRFGTSTAILVSRLCHLAAFASLFFLSLFYLSGNFRWVFLFCTGALLLFEQMKYHDVDLAFFRVNAGLGFVVFALIVAGVYGL